MFYRSPEGLSELPGYKATISEFYNIVEHYVKAIVASNSKKGISVEVKG